MHAFRDAAGRQWTITLNHTAYMKVYATQGIDLADISYGTAEPESLKKLANPWHIGQVLWILLEAQATAAGVTYESLCDAISGEVWQQAFRAIYDEMLFFCRPEMRLVLRALMDRADRMASDPATETMIREKIDEAFPTPTASSASWPESSESTPANGPSEPSTTPPPPPDPSGGITPPPPSPPATKSDATRTSDRRRSRRQSSIRTRRR
jgi:hypothetical protein